MAEITAVGAALAVRVAAVRGVKAAALMALQRLVAVGAVQTLVLRVLAAQAS